VKKVELFGLVSCPIDYRKTGCYNASVAGACTQAFDPTEVHLSSDAPVRVAESLRT